MGKRSPAQAAAAFRKLEEGGVKLSEQSDNYLLLMANNAMRLGGNSKELVELASELEKRGYLITANHIIRLAADIAIANGTIFEGGDNEAQGC